VFPDPLTFYSSDARQLSYFSPAGLLRPLRRSPPSPDMNWRVFSISARTLHDLFGHATQAYTKARLRTLKDLDQAAIVLVKACRPLLDPALPDGKLRAKVFAKIPRAELAQALEAVETLVRPPDDVVGRAIPRRATLSSGGLEAPTL